MVTLFCSDMEVTELNGVTHKQTLLKGVKFKTPPRESEELDRFYDMVFSPDAFFASWAGRVDHYAYGEHPHQVAQNQDGYVYLWPETSISGWTQWKMSANADWARDCCCVYVEIIL